MRTPSADPALRPWPLCSFPSPYHIAFTHPLSTLPPTHFLPYPPYPSYPRSDPLSRYLLPLRRIFRTEVVLALAEAGQAPGALAADERGKSVGERKAEGELLMRGVPSATQLAQAALGNNHRALIALAGTTDGRMARSPIRNPCPLPLPIPRHEQRSVTNATCRR